MDRLTRFGPPLQIATLLVAGVGIEHAVFAFERWIPRTIYFEPSFTLALLGSVQWLVLPVLLFTVPLFWRRSNRLDWDVIDSIGGFRWVVFGIAVSLCWSYAGYPINHYFGQTHALDRWLLIGTTIAILRSPALLPLFLFELAVCRAQLRHPVAALTPIGDELPLRLIGMITAAVVINLAVQSSAVTKVLSREQETAASRNPWVVPTPILVFATLCLVGSYYGNAGIAKLTIGESPIDWITGNHLENLFVGTYLKGWQWVGTMQSVVDWSSAVATIGPFVSAATVIIECGMIFILVHRVGTVGLLTCMLGMHLGIVALSGIFFWKWLVVEIALGLWLWWARDNRSLDAIYSKSHAVISVVVIIAFMNTFKLNDFTWWNTNRYAVLEIEAQSTDGSTCSIDAEDFSPYMLVDYIRPAGAARDTFGFGSTLSQALMSRTEELDAAVLSAALRKRRKQNAGATNEREKHNINDFMGRYIANQNRWMEQSADHSRFVFPFVFPAPLIHLKARSSRSHPRCEGELGINEIAIRLWEPYFTGKQFMTLDDQVLHKLQIPASR